MFFSDVNFTAYFFFRDKLPNNMKMLVFFLAKCFQTAAKTMVEDRKKQKALAPLTAAKCCELNIAQNAYCSWDIYLQSSNNRRSVILPILLQLSAFDWLMITRTFFHWEYLLLIKVQEVEQRDNTYARHC